MSNAENRQRYYDVVARAWGGSELYTDAVLQDIEDTGGDPEAAGQIYLIEDEASLPNEQFLPLAFEYIVYAQRLGDSLDLNVAQQHCLERHRGVEPSDPQDMRGVAVATEFPTGSDEYPVFDPEVHVEILPRS